MSDVDDAHRHSSRNSALLADSAGCGCFYCLAIYPPSEIADGPTVAGRPCVPDAESTALSPTARGIR